MSRVFTRQEFYDLVWSKPMTHLAKEFALSDVALHKICRKHGIPNPPLGWWAKKAAGKAVQPIPLPELQEGASDRITVAAGEIRNEPEFVSAARENARVSASLADADPERTPDPIVVRTLAKLRKTKPSTENGLASVGGQGLIKVSAAPASIDRVELALNRLAAALEALNIRLEKDEKGVHLICEDEVIGFSISEGVRREKHVLTPKELAEDEADQKRLEKRWNNPTRWYDNVGFSYRRRPDWDYHPTGLLAFELEQTYLLAGSPRRSFKDAKVQRLENMAPDIAVGIAVFAAAKKQDRLKREAQARAWEEERRQRELAMRSQHIAQRRDEALDKVLDELAALDRLRRLIAGLRLEAASADTERVRLFLEFAEQRLAFREAALSPSGLEARFTNEHLFGEDDDRGFKLPSYY